MKKIIEIVFNRVTISVLFLLLQLGWVITVFWRLRDYSTWIGVIVSLLSILAMLHIIASKQNSSYKISWLVFIGLMPTFGILLYLLVSNKLPAKGLRSAIQKNNEAIAEQMAGSFETEPELPPRLRSTLSYMAKQGPYPVHANTSVRYFEVGERMFAAMLEDLKKAEKFIFFEYFIVGEGVMWQQMREIFIQKAQQGVDVRVMYDDFGSIPVLPKNLKKDLQAHGVKVIAFNPLMPIMALGVNNRDHRKILVIDGNVGYNGGINISDEYINVTSPREHWKDTGIRLEGQGVVNLTTMFLSLWHAYDKALPDIRPYFPTASPQAQGYVQSFSDSPLDDEQQSETLYMDILWQAKDYVYIFTPYLIITDEMSLALKAAAKRGIDVRILIPRIADSKLVQSLAEAHYPELIEAGVRVYRYTPGYVHAKSYLSDDSVAIVGTINMDYRSLYLHFECGTIFTSAEAIAALKKDYLDTFAISEEILPEQIKNGRLQTLRHAVLKILSPLT